jgi:hypothetical protein
MNTQTARRLFAAMTNDMGCGQRHVLNRFDCNNLTLLMHAIISDTSQDYSASSMTVVRPLTAASLLMTHPLVDVDACALPTAKCALPTAFHTAVYARNTIVLLGLLSRMTDPQLCKMMLEECGGASRYEHSWPLLVRTTICGAMAFLPLLARVTTAICPSGTCGFIIGDPCVLCNVLSANSHSGETILTHSFTSLAHSEIWPTLVNIFCHASPDSCISRLFLHACWLPPVGCAPTLAAADRWRVHDPLRAAMFYIREHEAVWLITHCLPDWALNAYDCDGQTLLIRAAACRPPLLRVVNALLKRAPHLDTNQRAIQIRPSESVRDALLRSDLAFGPAAAQSIPALAEAPASATSTSSAAARAALVGAFEEAARLHSVHLIHAAALVWRILQPQHTPTANHTAQHTPTDHHMAQHTPSDHHMAQHTPSDHHMASLGQCNEEEEGDAESSKDQVPFPCVQIPRELAALVLAYGAFQIPPQAVAVSIANSQP